MSRKSSDFFVQGTPCNAAATVSHLLGEPEIVKQDLPEASSECRALSAALSRLPEEKRNGFRHEFITLTGSAECKSLRGLRCAYFCDLAAELVRKYRRASDPAGKTRVLLLGDSIRANYENVVRRELGDSYDLVAPEENCRFAKFALNELDRWFDAYGEPDIIHWNIGLWDSAVVCPEDGMFTSPEEYLFYMSRIHRELRKHCPHLVFATTTPVREGSLNQHLEYIDRLNAVIVPFMQAQGVRINDLYSLVKPRINELLQRDCIHLSPAGMDVCGKAVAAAIRSEIAR